MRNYFTLDGVDSRDYGVYISGQGVFNAPVRAINYITIPGRNGDLIGLPTRLENVELAYNGAFIYRDFKNQIQAFKSFLLSSPGYRKLIDTYNPNEYRLVAYNGGLNVSPTSKNDAGQFDIVFTAKPQRYLISGDNAITLTSNGVISNPTLFAALPLVRVFGSGTFSINGVEIIVADVDTYINIDFENGYAYDGINEKNNSVTVNALDFPALLPGDNYINISRGITKIEITPRWWVV